MDEVDCDPAPLEEHDDARPVHDTDEDDDDDLRPAKVEPATASGIVKPRAVSLGSVTSAKKPVGDAAVLNDAEDAVRPAELPTRLHRSQTVAATAGLAPSRLPRSNSSAQVDQRSDRELLQHASGGRPLAELESIDFGDAARKLRKSFKSLRSLAECTALKHLHAANNSVATMDGLDALVSLETLCLSRNHLKRIDAPIASLTCLRVLDLAGNAITHVPKVITSLKALEVLNLSGNNLGVLKEIDALSKLSNLHDCNFSANPFSKLPTYRDYVLSKLPSIDRLDDAQVTAIMRDKSRRRFNDALFSKDATLRENSLQHENEQNKLRELQSTLEAENMRLRGELNVKSKLLHNKSKEWSTATEQLLQLQQELAMLNLDRRPNSPKRSESQLGSPVASMSDRTRASSTSEMLDMSLASPRRSSLTTGSFGHTSDSEDSDSHSSRLRPDRLKRVSSRSSLGVQAAPSSPLPPTNQFASPRREQSERPADFRVHLQAAIAQVALASELEGERLVNRYGQASPVTKKYADSACSPLQILRRASAATDKVVKTITTETNTGTDACASPRMSNRSKSFDNIRKAFAQLANPTGEDVIADEDLVPHENVHQRPSMLKTIEDDAACPAYEDAEELANLSRLRDSTQSPGRQLVSPSPSPRLRSVNWFQKSTINGGLQLNGSSEDASLQASIPLHPTEKDAMVRHIQALQGRKQFLLAEIAREEKLLHVMRQESAEWLDQIDRLSANIQACITDQPRPAGSPIHGADSGTTSPRGPNHLRPEDNYQPRLEMLRNKLRFAENKEAEIEMTIVRLTKRVLQQDMQSGSMTTSNAHRSLGAERSSNSMFDKEIFALTHKLQLVIVQKEEINLEMSRLMTQMKGNPNARAAAEKADREGRHPRVIEERGATTMQALEQRDEEDQALIISRAALEELTKRYREVDDRIEVKEALIGELVRELKSIEQELAEMSQLSPRGRQRSRAGWSISPQSLSSQLMKRIDEGDEGPVNTSQAATALVAMKQSYPSDDTSSMDCNASVTNEVPSGTEQTNKKVGGVSDEKNDKLKTLHDPSNLQSLEIKFKELLTAEMLEEIKKDIFEKLSQQLVPGTTDSKSANSDKETAKSEFHEAIAAALETQMRMAMERFQKQKNDEENHEKEESTTSNQTPSPIKRSMSPRKQRGPPAPDLTSVMTKEDEVGWDQLDDFEPVDARYSMKYRFSRDRVNSASSPNDPRSSSSRQAGVQRILKACERLDIAETECRVDPVSSIEVDLTGKKRSTLKILLMGARDLPTSHLRTKNLDPYVTFEVVYPDYVVPPQSQTTTTPSTMSRHIHSTLAFGPSNSNSSSDSRLLRSRTKKKTMYPVWDEEFEYAPILSLKGYLSVRVLNDRKLTREQVIGETRIPLRTLLHQKKTVEWFSLRVVSQPSAKSLSLSRANNAALRTCGGAIRLQLQLTFSRVERLKRTVDELVTKYFHEHNQLPPFIERVGQLEKRQGSRDDDMEPLFALREEIEAQENKSRKVPPPIITSFPIDELENSLHRYESWRHEPGLGGNSDQAMASPQRQVAPASPARAAYSSVSARSQHHAHSVSATTHVQRTKRSTSPTADESRRSYPLATEFLGQPSQPRVSTAASAITTSKKRAASPIHSRSMARPPVRKATAIQSKVPSGTSVMPLSAKPKPTRPNPRLSYAALAPTRHGSAFDDPECFDDYSPYHPDFQFNGDIISVGSSNNQYGGRRNTKYGLSTWDSPRGVDDRKTDLRIFKSPGFGRREPTQGFPERYIGLDNQTSERLKRMFGRMDSNGS
ncbi:TPA: hypothetical protein N0F65_009970 [Lagenidium giganteum]|uniref:C2 domain-containing protein n=1 Tax=Lagenidium giganteum TaxID=4803 RepID=A0AAV2YS33_9STRA|nr:TPA: hypothetical protein N0F65_009970 [Lagenidium giganteum]